MELDGYFFISCDFLVAEFNFEDGFSDTCLAESCDLCIEDLWEDILLVNFFFLSPGSNLLYSKFN